MMIHEELIAALEAAPVGTRELGVAVLEAIGCRCMHARRLDAAGSLDTEKWWEDATERKMPITFGSEHLVVTDLNFRLPGVPEGDWNIDLEHGGSPLAELWVPDPGRLDGYGRPTRKLFYGIAHTERLARCIAELKAVLAARHPTISTQEAQEAP